MRISMKSFEAAREPRTRHPAAKQAPSGGPSRQDSMDTAQAETWNAKLTSSPRIVAQRAKLQSLIGEKRQGRADSATHALGQGVAQRQVIVGKDEYARPFAAETNDLLRELREHDDSDLWKRGWIGQIREMVKENRSHKFKTWDKLIQFMNDTFGKSGSDDEEDWDVRPNFSKVTYDLAKATSSIHQDKDLSSISLQEHDLAVPHRMPFADLRMNLKRFTSGTDTSADLIRWTDRLLEASRERMELNQQNDVSGFLPAHYQELVERQIEEFEKRRTSVVELHSANDDKQTAAKISALKKLLASLNGLHGNVPDIGPHSTVNIRVSDRVHPNFLGNGRATPGTKAALAMSPYRFSKGIATTVDGGYLVTPGGQTVPSSILAKTPHKFSKTRISHSELTPKKLIFTDGDSDSDSD
jgi:hypothetical protein